MSDDQEAQDDELLALASIYDEDEFRRTESGREGEIHLSLEPPQDFKLLVSGSGEKSIEYDVKFLPPLFLRFKLPVDYPSSSAPVFMLSSKWLSRLQLSGLCKRLDDIWQENQGGVVLFTWIQFLKEEALDFLGLQSPLEISSISRQQQQLQFCWSDGGATPTENAAVEKKKHPELDPRAVLAVDPDADLLRLLLDYDEAQRQKVFDSKLFCCGICFVEKLGSNCSLFKECQHVYCKACVKEYFQVLIQDGQVQNLNCPEPKCTSVATPSQVKLLMEEDEFEHYDNLLLKSSLRLMADIVYCPRTTCGMAVVQEPNSTMGLCLSCCYAFCTLCYHTYHGISRCKPTLEELQRLQEEEEMKCREAQELATRERFAAEESFSEKWLAENSKKCPHCGVHIQKVSGCNRMVCFHCRETFCWECLVLLPRVDPYSHFQDLTRPCYYNVYG